MVYWECVVGTIVAMLLGSVCSLVGVVIGGFFVLRTKRDGYEPLIPPVKQREEQTAAINLDDVEDESYSTIEDILKSRAEEESLSLNAKFRSQMDG